MNASDRLASLMPIVIKDDQLHARWLNTFSYLEYVGFRKIIKSQRADVLSRAFLNHALEEGGHAFLLKNMAVKVGGKDFDFYTPETMLCRAGGERLFPKSRSWLRREIRQPARTSSARRSFTST